MSQRIPSHLSQNPPTAIPSNDFELSRIGVEIAAAKSIARFFILISWSSWIFSLHGCLLWFYVAKSSLYWAVIIPGAGRLLLTWFQASSVMTYSCYYKGVFTWAAPISQDPRFGNWSWNEAKQESFSGLVWVELGRHYHAKVFFYIIKVSWPLVISRIFPGLERGKSMFASFRSPPEDEFIHGGELELTVWEKGMATEYPIYKVNFMKVPGIISPIMKNPLVPSRLEKRIFGLSTIIPIILGIFDAIIIGCSNSTPVPKSLYTVEQLAVSVLRYYDFSDSSINTKLDDRKFPTNEDYDTQNRA